MKNEHIYYWMLASDPRFLTNRYIEMVLRGERLYGHELKKYGDATQEPDRLFCIVQHHLTEVKLCDDVMMASVIEGTRWGQEVHKYLTSYISYAERQYKCAILRQALLHSLKSKNSQERTRDVM